jgi:hypothetical protein
MGGSPVDAALAVDDVVEAAVVAVVAVDDDPDEQAAATTASPASSARAVQRATVPVVRCPVDSVFRAAVMPVF